ncbi:MAG: hypothetical protein ACTHNM_17180 [Dyella sp.]|uniref:hypothetical protein n=1 Tax=Dyella sp. TaxID=1869338 RepID=UPI003F80D277
MLRAQIAALEQRIDALEEVLRVQAVIIGQYMKRSPGRSPPPAMDRDTWIGALRSDTVPEMRHPIIESLQASLVIDYPPTAESLHDWR